MRFEYFQMIDRIAALDLGERSIRALCNVPQESPIFEGHFPGYPLMPGVLQIECMAQTCGWLVSALNKFAAMPFLIAVKEAKFRSPVLPGVSPSYTTFASPIDSKQSVRRTPVVNSRSTM